MLLPLQVSTYNMFVRQYLMSPYYQGRLLITPKLYMSIDYKKQGIEYGGSLAFCWYEWDTTKPRDTKYEIYEDLKAL